MELWGGTWASCSLLWVWKLLLLILSLITTEPHLVSFPPLLAPSHSATSFTSKQHKLLLFQHGNCLNMSYVCLFGDLWPSGWIWFVAKGRKITGSKQGMWRQAMGNNIDTDTKKGRSLNFVSFWRKGIRNPMSKIFNDNKEFRGGKPLIFTRVSNPWLEKHTTSLETGRLKVTGWKKLWLFFTQRAPYWSNSCILLPTLWILAELLNTSFR